MKPQVKYSLLAVGLGGIMIGSFVLISAYRAMNENSMKACVLSLETPIVDSITNNDPKLNISLSNEWKTLSSDESKALVGHFVNSGKTDCGTIKSMHEGKDYWGNRIVISLRHSEPNTINIRVWSTGPDGKENTSDDIGFESNQSLSRP